MEYRGPGSFSHPFFLTPLDTLLTRQSLPLFPIPSTTINDHPFHLCIHKLTTKKRYTLVEHKCKKCNILFKLTHRDKTRCDNYKKDKFTCPTKGKYKQGDKKWASDGEDKCSKCKKAKSSSS